MKNYKNVVYILTNPLYAGYVKIGYASDLYARLASLNTGMLRNFEPYAVYETEMKNADVQVHNIIDDLAPIVRARVINGQKVQDKEFFKLEPEQAYDLLMHIAKMTGTENKLHKDGDDNGSLPLVQPYVQQPSNTSQRNYAVNDNLKSLFYTIDDAIKSVDSRIESETMKVYVKYSINKKVICSIDCTKTDLNIYLNADVSDFNDMSKLKDVSHVGHHGVGKSLFKCSDTSSVDDVKSFVKQTIEILKI